MKSLRCYSDGILPLPGLAEKGRRNRGDNEVAIWGRLSILNARGESPWISCQGPSALMSYGEVVPVYHTWLIVVANSCCQCNTWLVRSICYHAMHKVESIFKPIHGLAGNPDVLTSTEDIGAFYWKRAHTAFSNVSWVYSSALPVLRPRCLQ